MKSGPRLFSTSPIEPVASAQEQHIPLHNGLEAQPHTSITQEMQAFCVLLSAGAAASLPACDLLQGVRGSWMQVLAWYTDGVPCQVIRTTEPMKQSMSSCLLMSRQPCSMWPKRCAQSRSGAQRGCRVTALEAAISCDNSCARTQRQSCTHPVPVNDCGCACAANGAGRSSVRLPLVQPTCAASSRWSCSRLAGACPSTAHLCLARTGLLAPCCRQPELTLHEAQQAVSQQT